VDSMSVPSTRSTDPGSSGEASAGASPDAPRPIDWDIFTEISETASYVFWLVQLEPERVLYVSPGFEQIWQRASDDLYQDPRLWVAAIHPDDRGAVLRAYESFLRDPDASPFDLEYRIVRGDGETRWIHDRARAVRSNGRDLDRVAGMAEDVTRRHVAEGALRESEQRFRQLVQSLPMPIWTCAPDGACTFLSDTWLDYTGVPMEAQLGDRWLEQLHPDDRARAARVWRAAVQSGEPYRIEYRIRRHDGEYRWFDTQGAPIRDEHGAIVKWFGANTDIHESRLLRESLREQQERFTKIAETVPGAIHSFRRRADGAMCFPYASAKIRDIYGVEPEALAEDGTPVVGRTHPADAERVRGEVLESARTMSPFHTELRAQMADGQERWIEIRSQPVVEADGSITWHGFLADVTPRKRIEAEIRSLNAALEDRVRVRTAELEAANRELEAFSYSVSHDLRAPLRAVDGYSSALVEDFGASLPPDAHRYVQEVRDGAQRMGTLIDDLLAFSRLGRQTLARRRVDTDTMVRGVLAELTTGAADRPLVLRVGALEPCEGDPALIRQVWVNLLSNALKYTRGRTPAIVEIGCERGDAQTVYVVRDNGAGFDMRYASKLFRVFQRLHRADEFEGTGVGLAIVKRIVDRHGGQVSVEATPGGGAVFRFSLSGGSEAPAFGPEIPP
jgi:PAS domain S-box-containing protein